MAEYLIQGETLTAIADEVRELSGTTDAMGVDAMTTHVSDANAEITSQTDLVAQIKTALEGKASDSGDPVLQNKTVTPTKSQQPITPDANYDGLASVTVEPIPDNYIDTSDATAAATDMAEGVTAYVNGEKITGSVKAYSSLVGWANRNPSLYEGDKVSLSMPTTTPYLFRQGFMLASPLSNFGNVTASDVVSGKTFTSAAGLLVTGELVVPTIHTGSSTPDSSLGSDGDIYFVVQEV